MFVETKPFSIFRSKKEKIKKEGGNDHMGKTKAGNANAQRNNQAKQKNGYPKITNYAQMEAEIMREKKRD